MKNLCTFAIMLLLFVTASAQHEFDKWIFGNGAGLDFSSGSPVAITSNIAAWDNSGSIADGSGNLLFYSQGMRIWDKNGNVMPNGDGILGDTSGGQPATIVRKPGNENLYYVFTCPNFGGPNGLRYTIVDMTLNGGLGDVDTNNKNILFYTPTAEKLVPVVHANGYDIWIIAHEWNTNTFRSYLLTANGFVSAHVSSTIGSIHGGNTNNAIGQLTVNKSGSKIACALWQDGKIELFNFNRQSGVLTNAISLSGYHGVLGLEFSPDESKLYATNYLGPNLTQFNLANYTQSAISASATTVGTIPTSWGNYYGGYLALGPDDKIYVVQSFSNKIGRIDSPNSLGLGCSYDGNAVSLGARSTDAGLVDKIAVTAVNYSMQVEAGDAQTICANSYVIFDPVVTGGVPPFTYSWTATGDTLACSNCKQPSVTVTQNSVYVVTATDANGRIAQDTIAFTVSALSSQLQLTLIKPNSIDCLHLVDTTYASLTNASAPVNYHWGDGSNLVGDVLELHTYSQEGVYVISVKDSSGCINSAFDTVVNSGIRVEVQEIVQPICAGDTSGKITLNVNGGTAPYNYNWSNLATTFQIDSVAAGSYSVTVTDVNACSTIFDYNLNPSNDVWGYYVYLTGHEANCGNTGSVVSDVQHGIAPYSYLWNTGDTTSGIFNKPGGDYSLVVTDSSGCKRSGHIQVESFCASIISGTVYLDTNQNCVRDTAEIPLSSIFLVASGHGHYYYGSSNSNGVYSIIVPDTGTYALSAFIPGESACSGLILCNNPDQAVTILSLGDSSLNNNFAATASSGFDLAMHTGWTAANPGFEKEYWIMPYNLAYTPLTGPVTVTLVYDSLLTYQYSLSPLPVHDPVAHSLTWTLASVPSGTWSWNLLRLRTFFHVPVSLSLGQPLHTDFYITPNSGDCDSTNNVFHSSEVVTGSLDPNEKDVLPQNSISPEDSVLQYTIHFQNCGTDSTHFVIVKDTLSPYLDVTTVRTVASSHPYSEFIVSGNGILKWIFNPLRLVDSLTNPRGSQGFVSFTVEKKKDLPVGVIFSNKASIYFDYNEPVVTNTVADTVMNILSANVSSIATNCGNSNGSATVAVSGGVPPFSYQWNGSQSGTTLNNLPAGSYEVTVSDSYGYVVTASANVAASTPVSATIATDKENMCANDTATICAPAGFASYQWNIGGTSECVKTAAAGNYYVTVTDNANCSAESNHLSVSVFAAPTVSISVNGDTLYAYNAYSYQWYLNGNPIPDATDNIYIANQAGNYSLEVTDANGCYANSNDVVVATGINEVRGGYINVFPNPTLASGNWNLDVDQSWIGSEVSIFDESGRLVEQFTIVKNRTTITSVKNSGVYLARVVSDKQCYSIRLVRLGN